MPARSYIVTVALSVDAGSAEEAADLAMAALADPEEYCLESTVEVQGCNAPTTDRFEFLGRQLTRQLPARLPDGTQFYELGDYPDRPGGWFYCLPKQEQVGPFDTESLARAHAQDTREHPPCLACGEYAPDHTPGCALAPEV